MALQQLEQISLVRFDSNQIVIATLDDLLHRFF
jgi:hypothetical protein